MNLAQNFNKSFNESANDPWVRASNPVVMNLKQDQVTFGMTNVPKKPESENSSANVSFKYSRTNMSQV
jgi:hypothetical protein